MERFNLIIVRPEAFVHHQAYAGAANILCAALRRLGHLARVADNQMIRDATNIVFGAHYLESDLVDALPPGTIIYNTEMVVSHSPFLPALIPFVRRFETWDYSEANVRAWREVGVSERVRWLRPGYVPECTTIDPATPTDIDAVFYGTMTERRRIMLDELSATGVRVQYLQNLYGAARDAYIARAKLVLNIHSRPDSMFEIARVSQALSNHRVLVSELGTRDDVDADLREGIALAPLSEFAALCRALLDDHARRKALAERGFEVFRSRDFVASVGAMLAPGTGSEGPP